MKKERESKAKKEGRRNRLQSHAQGWRTEEKRRRALRGKEEEGKGEGG